MSNPPTLQQALADYDAEVAACPFSKPSPPPTARPCPVCRATAREGCGRQATASHAFIQAARAIAAAQRPALPEQAAELLACRRENRALRADYQRLCRLGLQLADYADLMPKETPAAGGCSTLHQFAISAGAVWGLDSRVKAFRAALAGRYLPSEEENSST